MSANGPSPGTGESIPPSPYLPWNGTPVPSGLFPSGSAAPPKACPKAFGMIPPLQALRRRLWPDSFFETDFESQRVQRERATGATAHILESELDRLALLLSEVMTELV